MRNEIFEQTFADFPKTLHDFFPLKNICTHMHKLLKHLYSSGKCRTEANLAFIAIVQSRLAHNAHQNIQQKYTKPIYWLPK